LVAVVFVVVAAAAAAAMTEGAVTQYLILQNIQI
jgi:hypothetical protein